MSADGQRSKWCRNIAENFNRSSRAHERYRQTDRRQTDGGPMTYSERERCFVNMNSRILGLLPRCMECRLGLAMRILSVKCVECDKMEDVSPDFCTMRKTIYSSFLRRRIVGGGDPFYLKFWVNRPRSGAKSSILNRYSRVARGGRNT